MAVLKATYAAPNHEAFTVSHPVAAEADSTATSTATSTPSATPSTAAKTAHLAALRRAVKAAQDDINKELTARMVLDVKEGEAAAAAAKEEENYGEEMVEEE